MRRALFPGKGELDQLDLIFQICGAPTDENWPEAKTLNWYDMFKPKKPYKRNLVDYCKQYK